jgi:hypothetical protein
MAEPYQDRLLPALQGVMTAPVSAPGVTYPPNAGAPQTTPLGDFMRFLLPGTIREGANSIAATNAAADERNFPGFIGQYVRGLARVPGDVTNDLINRPAQALVQGVGNAAYTAFTGDSKPVYGGAGPALPQITVTGPKPATPTAMPDKAPAPQVPAIDPAPKAPWADMLAAVPKMLDPSKAAQTGVDQHVAYVQKILPILMDAAMSRGDPTNYATRLRSLMGAFGNMNLAHENVSGTNTINTGRSGLIQEGLRGASSLAQEQLRGQNQIDLHATDSVALGTELAKEPTTGVYVPTTTYGQRPTKAGAMPTPYTSAAKPAAKPVEGATGTTKDGRRFIIVNGQPVETKK